MVLLEGGAGFSERGTPVLMAGDGRELGGGWWNPGPTTISSHIMYLLISLRKSTPPQNRQPNIFISNRRQYVDDFGVDLIFSNPLLGTFCEISFLSNQPRSRCRTYLTECIN